MKLHINKKVAIGITVVAVLLVMLLPFYMGTKTYPIAIVNGNSMYPALQNGDIVLFKAANQQKIANGTVIVFVQSDTGVTLLDQLTKPIIIHRVTGSFVQWDGTIYYNTKGDNNNVNDPSAVEADHVLGTPVLVIPKAGILMLFISSAQGLVAIIGFITIFYLGTYEAKLQEEEAKNTFLGELSLMTMNGELQEEVFKKFEFAVKYANSVETEKLNDSTTLAIIDWLKKGTVEKGWKINKTKCPNCSTIASIFESSNNPLIICPRCISRESKHAPSTTHTNQTNLNEIMKKTNELLETINS